MKFLNKAKLIAAMVAVYSTSAMAFGVPPDLNGVQIQCAGKQAPEVTLSLQFKDYLGQGEFFDQNYSAVFQAPQGEPKNVVVVSSPITTRLEVGMRYAVAVGSLKLSISDIHYAASGPTGVNGLFQDSDGSKVKLKCIVVQ